MCLRLRQALDALLINLQQQTDISDFSRDVERGDWFANDIRESL